jgi:hypothetical protein
LTIAPIGQLVPPALRIRGSVAAGDEDEEEDEDSNGRKGK